MGAALPACSNGNDEKNGQDDEQNVVAIDVSDVPVPDAMISLPNAVSEEAEVPLCVPPSISPAYLMVSEEMPKRTSRKSVKLQTEISPLSFDCLESPSGEIARQVSDASTTHTASLGEESTTSLYSMNSARHTHFNPINSEIQTPVLSESSWRRNSQQHETLRRARKRSTCHSIRSLESVSVPSSPVILPKLFPEVVLRLALESGKVLAQIAKMTDGGCFPHFALPTRVSEQEKPDEDTLLSTVKDIMRNDVGIAPFKVLFQRGPANKAAKSETMPGVRDRIVFHATISESKAKSLTVQLKGRSCKKSRVSEPEQKRDLRSYDVYSCGNKANRTDHCLFAWLSPADLAFLESEDGAVGLTDWCQKISKAVSQQSAKHK